MRRGAGPARAAILWALGLHAVTAVAALTVWVVPVAGAPTRHVLQLSFEPRAGTLDEAADILLANARVVGAIVLLGAAVRRGFAPRSIALLMTGGLAAANAAVVGIAVGAYGIHQTVPWLAHLPLEWTALGIASSAVSTSDRGLSTGRTAALTISCLLAAALLETYATPQPT